MPTTHKVLGQVISTSGYGYSDVYVVPASTQAIISTIHLANVAGSAATVDVYVVKSGDTRTNKSALAYGTTIAANSLFALTEGITLAAGDKIVFGASTTNVSCNIFGAEIS